MEERKVIIDVPASTVFRILVILGLVGLLYLVRDVAMLIVLSFIFATSIRPVVDIFEKRKVPRALSILIVYGIISLFLFFVFRSIIPPIVSQISDIVQNKDYYLDTIHSYFRDTPLLNNSKTNSALEKLFDSLGNVLSGGALSGALGVFSGILGFLTVLVLSFYFLVDKKGIEENIPHYFIKEHSKRLLRVYRDISRKMTYWFWGQLGVAFMIGVLSFIGLTILGIDFALTLALVAMITAVIPIIGPFIGALAAVGIALTISPSKALAVVILYAFIQLIESNFITPLVMKKALGVSPAIVIIALLLGGKLFGFIGIILALPLAAMISVIIDELYKQKLEEERSSK